MRKIACNEEERRSGARRGVAGGRAGPYNEGLVERADDGGTVIELAQVGEVRECCGERYLLIEQQHGSLVRRWYAYADDREQRPLAACRHCATPLLPYSAPQPSRAAAPARQLPGPGER